jgi:uncharacterized membrane protein YdbT with pleckstrin-like domain
MEGIITEKNYPIQRLWVFKSILGSLFTLIFVVVYFLISSRLISDDTEMNLFAIRIFGPYVILALGFAIFYFIVTALRRANFHYFIEEKFLTLKQGILSKQQRHIPYGVIQNLFVKQDLFDRIFGLASLTIENASQGAGVLAVPQRRQEIEMVGSSGNKVSIPGLTKQNAETLKEIVLQKMKENPVEDSQSGL